MAQIEVVFGTLRKLSDPEYPGVNPTTYDFPQPSVKKIQSPLGSFHLIVTREKVLLSWDAGRYRAIGIEEGTDEPIRSNLVDLTRVVTRSILLTSRTTLDSPNRRSTRVRLVGPGEETGVTAGLIPPRPYFREEIELH